MPPYRTTRDDSTPLPEQTPTLKWATRIFVTLFTLPFFAIGFSMIGGGGFLGSQGGAASAFGVFGVLFGLAFIAVPSLILIRVWTADAPSPQALTRDAQQPADLASETPPPPAIPAMQSCQYCGRPRPTTEPTCPACGAH